MSIPSARFYRRRQKTAEGVRDYGFVAEFRDDERRPSRKRHSLKTKDWAVAKTKFDKWERAWNEGRFDPWNAEPPEDGYTVAAALDRFLAHCSDKGLASGSVATYKTVIGSLVKHLAPSYPLYGLRHADVQAWLDYRPKAGAKPRAETTRRSYQERVRIFCSWCVEERLLRANPIPPAKVYGKEGRKKSLPRFLTEEEEGRILRAIEADATLQPAISGGNRWLLNLVRFALGTGLRRGELLNLRWADISLDPGLVHVRNREGFTTKSGRERVVPLVGTALAVVRHLSAERATEDPDAHVFTGVGGDPVNRDYLSKRFAHYRDLARLPESVNFHGLRHTYATRLVQSGASVYKVMTLLGHANAKTTQQYAHLVGSDLRDDVDKAFGTAVAPASEPERLREENARLKAQLDAIKESLGLG